MRSLIAALVAASFAVSAHSDLVATNQGGDELRLLNAPCDHKVILDQLKPEFHSQIKRAQATIDDKPIKGCWIEVEEEKGVYTLFESGEGHLFLLETFKEEGT
jgi:hypothetical protein